jgi:protein gp37
MPNKTNISWCDYSSNPLRYRERETGSDVWFCIKKSPGCLNCYSEARAIAWGRGGPFTRPNLSRVEPYLHDGECRQLAASRAISGKRVFVGDMTDVFGDWVPDDFLIRLFGVFDARPDVVFQILTKRPRRLPSFAATLAGTVVGGWPANVWIGASVEDQLRAEQRIPHLLDVPAAVRFLSCEPLLGPIDLSPWLDRLQWVVVGGESGAEHRPMKLDWLTSIADQCQQAGVPCFVKQDAARSPGRQGRIPAAYWSRKEFPTTPL